MIDNAKISLSKFRNDSAFGEFLDSAKTVAEEFKAITEFSTPVLALVEGLFNYEAENEPITDVKTDFKIRDIPDNDQEDYKIRKAVFIIQDAEDSLRSLTPYVIRPYTRAN
ncbi:unnamed protein product [Parnassius apollo]|uniref:(apollo) hypothetical protein n=1 Tax=Parnassius apollo TaxID=110799 RepID=A0A8S3XMA9_PARAO|nr:unnamed protein product [Parnassius apollo]